MDELTKRLQALDTKLAALEGELGELVAAYRAAGRMVVPVAGLPLHVAAARRAIRAHITPKESVEARALREADETLAKCAARLAWAKALPDGEHLDKPATVARLQGELWVANARVQWLTTGVWPEHPNKIKDPYELASRTGATVDDARRALGLPVKERKPIPPIPR